MPLGFVSSTVLAHPSLVRRLEAKASKMEKGRGGRGSVWAHFWRQWAHRYRTRGPQLPSGGILMTWNQPGCVGPLPGFWRTLRNGGWRSQRPEGDSRRPHSSSILSSECPPLRPWIMYPSWMHVSVHAHWHRRGLYHSPAFWYSTHDVCGSSCAVWPNPQRFCHWQLRCGPSMGQCVVTLLNQRQSMAERPGRSPAQRPAQGDRGAIGAASAAPLLQPLILLHLPRSSHRISVPTEPRAWTQELETGGQIARDWYFAGVDVHCSRSTCRAESLRKLAPVDQRHVTNLRGLIT
jgi:hypothetical protein